MEVFLCLDYACTPDLCELVSSYLVVSLQKVLFTCAIIINKDVFSK